MAEHKHAEVLRAIADGKEVQWRQRGNWNDVEDLTTSFDPINFPEYEWRVKPQPKPDYCFYAFYDSQNRGCLSVIPQNNSGWHYKIKITIDGETNEPKSVELIK